MERKAIKISNDLVKSSTTNLLGYVFSGDLECACSEPKHFSTWLMIG